MRVGAGYVLLANPEPSPYPGRMFGPDRRTAEQAQSIAEALNRMADAWEAKQDEGPEGLNERLEKLELSRATWEAEMDAILIKAENRLKSANNAESRARTMLKHEAEFPAGSGDQSQEEREAELDAYFLQSGNASPGPKVPVQPLHLGLETSPKDRAVRMKFS